MFLTNYMFTSWTSDVKKLNLYLFTPDIDPYRSYCLENPWLFPNWFVNIYFKGRYVLARFPTHRTESAPSLAERPGTVSKRGTRSLRAEDVGEHVRPALS